MEVPFFTPATSFKYSQKIPYKIYQTWKTSKVSKNVYDIIQQTIRDNPEYEYYFYSDEKCQEYLLENYGQSYVDAFNSILPGAYKADFWRYAILAKEGGVYIDLDMQLLKPLRDILDQELDYYYVRDIPNGAIYQAFLACIPNEPIMIATCTKCFENINNKSMGNWSSVLSITGPLMMGDMYNQSIGVPPNTIIKPNNTKSTSISAYLDKDLFIVNNSQKIIKARTEDYKDSSPYGKAFHACSVYQDQNQSYCLGKKYGKYLVLLIILIGGWYYWKKGKK